MRKVRGRELSRVNRQQKYNLQERKVLTTRAAQKDLSLRNRPQVLIVAMEERYKVSRSPHKVYN